MARKTKQEAERTYQLLLDAAAKLFIRQGVAKTTLHEIALETGMTRGAVYWHFANKDAVLQALWERNEERIMQPFNDMLADLQGPTAAQSFRTSILNIVENILDDPELSQTVRIALHNVEFTDEETSIQHFLASKQKTIYILLTDAFILLQKQSDLCVDHSPELLAHALMNYINGLIHSYLRPRSLESNLAKDRSIMLNLFLNALLCNRPNHEGEKEVQRVDR